MAGQREDYLSEDNASGGTVSTNKGPVCGELKDCKLV
jgi:hypothetical protein